VDVWVVPLQAGGVIATMWSIKDRRQTTYIPDTEPDSNKATLELYRAVKYLPAERGFKELNAVIALGLPVAQNQDGYN
jgi:hypothetical protein